MLENVGLIGVKDLWEQLLHNTEVSLETIVSYRIELSFAVYVKKRKKNECKYFIVLSMKYLCCFQMNFSKLNVFKITYIKITLMLK